jgi:hypothetical protein
MVNEIKFIMAALPDEALKQDVSKYKWSWLFWVTILS